MSFLSLFLFSCAISVLNLDNKNIVSIGMGRPIITGAVIGYFINNLYFGILIGCIIELILINSLPIGAFIPPNGTIITGITLIISNYFHIYKSGTLIPFILMYTIFFGHIISRVSRLIWKRNTYLVERFMKNVQENKFHFARYNIFAILTDFVIYLLITLTGSLFGIFLFNKISPLFLTSFFINFAVLDIIYYLPLFVLIYMLNSFDLPKKEFFILAGIVMAFLLNILLIPPVFIIMIIGVLSYLILYSVQYYKEHYYEL